MIIALITQLLLPLVLLALLQRKPVGNFAGYALQLVSVGLCLLALSLTSPWILVPFWAPYLYALIFVAVAARQVGSFRNESLRMLPESIKAWSSAAPWILLGVVSAYVAAEAVNGRRPPNVQSADIGMPLGEGTYIVAHGGSTELINGHMMTLDETVPRFQAYRGQSYAIDILEIGRLGFRANGLQPEDPAAYKIFGRPVFAPCTGTVVATRNDRPDMPVPQMDLEVIEGNHVLIDCGEFELLLAHFKRGTIALEVGDEVSVGEEIGLVGNSGKTTEPHLHISAQKPAIGPQPLSGEPLALTIDGHFYVRNDRLQ